VVITASCEFVCRTWNLVGEKVAFIDDQEETPDFVRGFFTVNLAAGPTPRGETPTYVIASVGPFLSNVVTYQGE
jgi:hypothetical protein